MDAGSWKKKKLKANKGFQRLPILIRQRFGVVQHGADGISQIIFDNRFHDKLVDSHGQGFFLGDGFIKSGTQNDRNLRIDVHQYATKIENYIFNSS